MKENLKNFLGVMLCFLSFGFTQAQKSEFVVPQKIEVLEDKIFDFRNSFTNNYAGMAGAAAIDGSEFTTNIELENMEFNGNSNPYLVLGLNKGAKTQQFIQKASWTLTLKKQSKNSTKVSIELFEIIPDQWSKKEVNTKTTRSTGKLEAELKKFLLEKSEKRTKDSDSSADNAAIDSSAFSTDADQAAFDAMIAAGDAQRNKKTIVSKKLQNLFGNDFISIPAKSSVFIKALNKNPTLMECVDCENGLYNNWDFEDFNLIYAKTTDGQEYYAIKYFGNVKVKGLPYDLLFNDSSPGECKTKFARFNSQLYQTTVNIDENSDKALTVVDFKKDKNFVRLEFGNEYLTRIIVSNKEIH